MRQFDFSPLAADYQRFRVGYGTHLYEVIGERLTAGPEGPLLDLACGTGLSTEPLVRLARGPVFGSDIALNLIIRAPREARGQALRYLVADATRLPIAAGTLAGVTCAQALHWIPPGNVLPEVLRCLKPSGWFFAYWKYPHPDEPYQKLADDILTAMHGREIRQGFSLKVPPDFRVFGFASFERLEFEMRIPYTLESYVGFMRSRWRIKDLAGDRLEDFIAAYRLELAKLVPGGQPFEERNVIFLFAGQKP
jgi:SAM-dependent methyltransferase